MFFSKTSVCSKGWFVWPGYILFNTEENYKGLLLKGADDSRPVEDFLKGCLGHAAYCDIDRFSND